MSILAALEKMLERLDKMTPEELAIMVERCKVDPEKAQLYAYLERYILERGKTSEQV